MRGLQRTDCCQSSSHPDLSVPNTPGGNLGLIAAYSQLGRDEDARKVAEKFLEGRPGFSAKKWLDRFSLKNSNDKERFINALQKAGLK